MSPSSETLDWLAELVATPGPPGQEVAVRQILETHLRTMNRTGVTDAKGNLLTGSDDVLQRKTPARVLVTAHLDEIALLVTALESDGGLRVAPLGGVHPHKWGEGPVELLVGRADRPEFLPGVLSFGAIHTTAPGTATQAYRDGKSITFDYVRVRTGLSLRQLEQRGVFPGTRVVLARHRRTLYPLGEHCIGSYFLDDRADLVAWLAALKMLADEPDLSKNILFAATASEEVGGEGALYVMHTYQPEICVALEIGPVTPDAAFDVDPYPTVWVTDSYATMMPRDLELIAKAARQAEMKLHFQAVTRGGSDASCAASHGLCARPVTLAFPTENTHGFEIMHRDAMDYLARLLVAYLRLL